ncbi:Two-component response regulator ARR12, partial [Durusdinium trenchii]
GPGGVAVDHCGVARRSPLVVLEKQVDHARRGWKGELRRRGEGQGGAEVELGAELGSAAARGRSKGGKVSKAFTIAIKDEREHKRRRTMPNVATTMVRGSADENGSRTTTTTGGGKVNGNGSIDLLCGLYEDLKKSSTPDVPAVVQSNATEEEQKQSGGSSASVSSSTARNKRKLEKTAPSRGKKNNGKSQTGKKKRFTWSDELHRQFMATIFDIGLSMAKPKSILERMTTIAQTPTELTTEHIKSHLQKYRFNSKKTKELFMAQFEVAKKQAESFNDGKALNPGFHAYPMPVGSYPVMESFSGRNTPSSQASGRSDSNRSPSKAVDGSPQQRPPMIGTRASSVQMPAVGSGHLSMDRHIAFDANTYHHPPHWLRNSHGHLQTPQAQQHQCTCGASSSSSTLNLAGGQGLVSERHLLDDQGRIEHAGENPGERNQPVVIKQMEMQMKIHQQIQEQHEVQQIKNQQNRNQLRHHSHSDFESAISEGDNVTLSAHTGELGEGVGGAATNPAKASLGGAGGTSSSSVFLSSNELHGNMMPSSSVADGSLSPFLQPFSSIGKNPVPLSLHDSDKVATASIGELEDDLFDFLQ